MITWNQNQLTARLGIDYPIIQGPLGGLSSQRLTAAVSNFGGLGSFGAHSLEPEEIKDVIAEIRSLPGRSQRTYGFRWKTKVPAHLMKAHSTGASPRLPSISVQRWSATRSSPPQPETP